MHWNMVTDAEVRHMPVPAKLFAYADAYLTAAITSCRKMTLDAGLCTWPNGAVVLMLAAHSVELFLKGAILQKNPAANVWARSHNIEGLASDFHSEFAQTPIEWDIPFGGTDILFGTDFPEWLADAEIKALKSDTDHPSIRYRYPVAKGGTERRGGEGFEPHSFLSLLLGVKADFDRIRSLVQRLECGGQTLLVK
jgi:hypothetical protein